MRVLVTGHRGLIGQAVTNRLQAAGDTVVGFDRADGGDILDADALARAAAGSDAIVHLAALLGRPGETPADIMTVNVTGTWNVLAAARSAGAGRVINFSSVNALGIFSGNGDPDHLPITDDHPPRPTTPYGISKRLGEEMCRTFTLATGIATICIRPPWVASDAMRVAELAKRAANPESEWTPFWEYGAWVHVDDLADAVFAALRAPDPGHFCALVIAGDMASDHAAAELADRLLPGIARRRALEGLTCLVESGNAWERLGWRSKRVWK